MRWLTCLTLFLFLVGCGGNGDDGAAEPADGLQGLPASPSVRAVRLYPAEGSRSDWCVYRTWPDERIKVFADCGAASPVPHTFARGEASELLVFAVVESDPFLYLLVYDARRNIPSGRLPGVVDDGVDVYRLDRRSPGTDAAQLVTRLALGGFDHLVEAAADAAGLTACGVRSCYRIDSAGGVGLWSDTRLNGYEFVEVSASTTFADALVRSVTDGFSGEAAGDAFHYAWARIGPAGLLSLQPIAGDCVPHGIGGGSDTVPPGWSCASSAADLARLLEFELARMPAGGLMDYGTSNREGRVAWSQTYYLNGLLELSGPYLPVLGSQFDQAALRSRVAAEIDLLARLGDTPGGYSSQRYSMQRTPVTFALHLGRVARTLALAKERRFPVPEAALTKLFAPMWALDTTVEQPASVPWRGLQFETLRYRPGADFWCDGANVPHNFSSAYTHGLLSLQGSEAAVRQRVATLLAPLLQWEPLAGGSTWNYWWGTGFDGWTAADAVSLNTPDYPGYRDPAHISYRSLDALAVLRLAALSPGAVPPAVVQNIRALVEQGSLLPWVSSELARAGSPAGLSRATAYRHARSAGPWELEAQVWALERLAAGR